MNTHKKRIIEQNNFYLSVDFEGYGFRIKAPSQEEAMTNVNKGYQQLVRCFVDLLQLNDTKVFDIFNNYGIEVFFE